MKFLSVSSCLNSIHHDILCCHKRKLRHEAFLDNLRIYYKTIYNQAVLDGASAAEIVPTRAEAAIGYAAEEEMYAIVRDALSADECVIDPIGRLIDWDRFNKMDSAERSRYVLELSKIYLRLKDRYYREKSRKKEGSLLPFER